MLNTKHAAKKEITIDLIRHLVLNSLRMYSQKFRGKYGKNLVICCDSSNYWRRQSFPYYKASRKKARDSTGHDWAMIHDAMSVLKKEFAEFLPYKVVEAYRAEADDVIATLVQEVSDIEPILIISSDKDFLQLQSYSNVNQYSPLMERFISIDDPKRYTKEHIIRGDRGDGIPNILSPDGSFVNGERQKSITKIKLAEWMELEPDQFCTTEVMKRGYERNKELIDLTCIPEDIRKSIYEAFNAAEIANGTKVLEYFMAKKLKNLTEVLNEF